jgi:copper resistance protein B
MMKIKYLLCATSLLASSICHAGMMEDPWVGQILFDKFEINPEQSKNLNWTMDAKLYQNLSGFIWRSEGSHADGETESENMFLYSKGFKPYWDWQIGIGQDTGDIDKTWGVIGVSGMAPYFFESNANLLINDDGALFKADFEREYLITQRLIWAPEIEVKLASTKMPDIGIGSGLSSIKLGLRLRCEFSRKFAPYAGIEWHKNFGETAKISGIGSDTQAVLGVRFWF